LKTGTDDLPREEKLAVLKECLSVIGRRIDIVVADKRHAGMDADKWRKHLWV
jgi:chromodomain-helicase-DNA-binding protein 1